MNKSAHIANDFSHGNVVVQLHEPPRLTADVNFSSRNSLVSRVRFQLLGAFVVCLVLPLSFWLWSRPQMLLQPYMINSIAGVLIAIVVGFVIWRRIDSYATVEACAYVFWSFIPVFMIVIFSFMMFRLEYNRYVFFTALALSQLWFMAIHFWSRKSSQVVFGVIEGGGLGEIRDRGRTRFVALTDPGTKDELQDISLNGVIADLRHNHDPKWETFMANLTLAGIPVYHFKQIEEDFSGQVSIEYLSENSFGSILPHLNYLKVKQLLDWMLVLLSLPIVIPLCLMASIAILVSDGGPVVYRQKRMGFRAKPIYAYKFRSMTNEPSQHTQEGAAITLENDPRITPVGQFLRKYRIDELPQVINILKGEMSWIGPRPEAIELSRMYEKEIPFYRYRHAVRPGITGWAQVNQGHVTDVQDVHQKLKYDFYYIKNISFWVDLLIILKTFRTVLSGFGAK